MSKPIDTYPTLRAIFFQIEVSNLVRILGRVLISDLGSDWNKNTVAIRESGSCGKLLKLARHTAVVGRPHELETEQTGFQ